MNHTTLTRAEMAQILARHRGSKAELARQSGVGATAVTSWLRVGFNANIDAHAQKLCRELLAKEARRKAA